MSLQRRVRIVVTLRNSEHANNDNSDRKLLDRYHRRPGGSRTEAKRGCGTLPIAPQVHSVGNYILRPVFAECPPEPATAGRRCRHLSMPISCAICITPRETNS